MVSKLDIPIRQVMIESRIVNADESFTRDLGVQFGYSKHSSQASQGYPENFLQQAVARFLDSENLVILLRLIVVQTIYLSVCQSLARHQA